jgi:hypothetical protein
MSLLDSIFKRAEIMDANEDRNPQLLTFVEDGAGLGPDKFVELIEVKERESAVWIGGGFCGAEFSPGLGVCGGEVADTIVFIVFDCFIPFSYHLERLPSPAVIPTE